MASDFEISEAARTAACDAIVNLVDGGAGAGYCAIWKGTIPATPATADDGTGTNLLGTVTFADPAFDDAAAGVAEAGGAGFDFTPDSSADNSGDAVYFRVKDSDATCIFQGTCGEAGDSPDMVFNNKTIVQGGTIDITSMTVTVPAG